MHKMENRMRLSVSGAVALAFTLAAAPSFAADASHGKQLFTACAACHTEKADALGPSLKGIVGRKSASLEDFRYSNAMKRANLTWTEDNLREYLSDPQAKVKGNRMPFSGFSNPNDVSDVIAYLQTLK